MIETERGTFVRRVVNFALGRGFQGGRNGSAAAGESAAQQTLMWLAGAGYRPRKETATLRPASRHERELADRLLSAERPADPVEAAAKRSELLTGLREGAREDARVIALFEDDPVVIEDPVSHRIVTESILSARYSHFDALNALFGAPPLGEPARQALRTALTDAFPLLSPAAQQEWALSEFRLAQTLGFLQRREEGEILALAAELRPVFEMRGGWETGRLLSHAAALGSPEAGRRLPVGDLLEPDPARAEP